MPVPPVVEADVLVEEPEPRRSRAWLWALLVGPALVFQSAHTITDVVGGALVGLIVVVAVYPLVASARTARTAG